MEKLSKKFYNEIRSKVESYIGKYMPDDYDLDFDYNVHFSRGEGSTITEFEIKLSDGYVAEVTLRVYTQIYRSNGDYFSPPESSGCHSWEVTHLEIWAVEGELVEELNDSTYMEGEYEW